MPLSTLSSYFFRSQSELKILKAGRFARKISRRWQSEIAAIQDCLARNDVPYSRILTSSIPARTKLTVYSGQPLLGVLIGGGRLDCHRLITPADERVGQKARGRRGVRRKTQHSRNEDTIALPDASPRALKIGLWDIRVLVSGRVSSVLKETAGGARRFFVVFGAGFC